MPDDALRVPALIEAQADAVEELIGTSRVTRRELVEALEKAHDAHLATLPVAEPCDQDQLLRDCRQRLLIESDAESSQLTDRIDAALGAGERRAAPNAGDGQ